jgi:hypothetical protein
MFRMLGAALVLWLCFHGAVLASPLYTIEELLPLPGHTTAHAHALNDSGQVVGYSYMPLVGEWPLNGSFVSPMFWENGTGQNLSEFTA